MKVNRIAAAVLGMQMLVGLVAVPALAAGKSQTLTGEVSDAMCGAKHEMPGKAGGLRAQLREAWIEVRARGRRQGLHAGDLG